MLPSPEFSGCQELAALAAVQHLTMCETAAHGMKGAEIGEREKKGTAAYPLWQVLICLDAHLTSPNLTHTAATYHTACFS